MHENIVSLDNGKIEEMHLHLRRIQCLAIGYILYLPGKATSQQDTPTYLAALVLIQKRFYTLILSNIRFLLRTIPYPTLAAQARACGHHSLVSVHH